MKYSYPVAQIAGFPAQLTYPLIANWGIPLFGQTGVDGDVVDLQQIKEFVVPAATTQRELETEGKWQWIDKVTSQDNRLGLPEYYRRDSPLHLRSLETGCSMDMRGRFEPGKIWIGFKRIGNEPELSGKNNTASHSWSPVGRWNWNGIDLFRFEAFYSRFVLWNPITVDFITFCLILSNRLPNLPEDYFVNIIPIPWNNLG